MKTSLLKNFNLLSTILIVLLFVSCQNNDDIGFYDISGTYTGTLTSILSSRSSKSDTAQPATAEVLRFGNQIQVHCFTENFDFTITLDTYNHNDYVMVCLTGEDFENLYGHKLGHGNMNGNMSGGGTPWMQHLTNEHQEGDEHFGNFDMQQHRFNYTFMTNNGEYHFEGIKN